MPRPQTRQRPSSSRVISAPRALSAAAVRITSSPSSKPSIPLSPTASAASMRARCDIDLSPGTRRLPARPWLGCALKVGMADVGLAKSTKIRALARPSGRRCALPVAQAPAG